MEDFIPVPLHILKQRVDADGNPHTKCSSEHIPCEYKRFGCEWNHCPGDDSMIYISHKRECKHKYAQCRKCLMKFDAFSSPQHLRDCLMEFEACPRKCGCTIERRFMANHL